MIRMLLFWFLIGTICSGSERPTTELEHHGMDLIGAAIERDGLEFREREKQRHAVGIVQPITTVTETGSPAHLTPEELTTVLDGIRRAVQDREFDSGIRGK